MFGTRVRRTGQRKSEDEIAHGRVLGRLHGDGIQRKSRILLHKYMVRVEHSHLRADWKVVLGQVVSRRLYGDGIVHLDVVYGGEGYHWGIVEVQCEWRNFGRR
jgi:hypothetical protein